MQMVPIATSGGEPMLMPSMTMTIQPNGVELSTSSQPASSGSSPSGALMQQASVKFSQQVADLSGFDQPGGEHYYSSPWAARRRPLASPAKLLRNVHSKAMAATRPTRLPQQQQVVAVTTSTPQPAHLQQQQQQPAPHMKTSQWRPTSYEVSGRIRDEPTQQLQQHQQQEHSTGQQEVEHEQVISVGPPQMIPIYQTPNGQLHATPPPPPSSPAQQQHEHKPAAAKRKPPPVVSGGY